MIVLSTIAGIGFTVALFFATASFPAGTLLEQAKIGALLSLSSGAIAALVARAEADAATRARIVADLESALEAEGIAPTPSVVAALRACLDTD